MTGGKQIALTISSGGKNTGVKGSSGALVASQVIRPGPGTLIHLRGHNSGPDQFLQLFDAAAVPSNGATPESVWHIPANSNFYIEVPLCGEYYRTGIVVCNSSTLATKTVGAADMWLNWVVH